MLLPKILNAPINFLFICFLLTLAPAGMAQIAGGMNETTSTGLGGNNFLAGTVFSPSGMPINSRMRIKLSSPMAGEYITTTDDRGQFVFSGLAAGNYFVTIDGERNYEAATQSVEILQSRTRQTYTISIRLMDKPTSLKKPGVINQESAKIPKKAMLMYQKALELSKDGNYQGAIEQLKLAIAEYPDFIMAFNELGVQYLKLNEFEKADEALKAALKINGEAFEPLVNRGILLFRQKKYDEAESVLRNILKLKESAVVNYYLGRTLTSLERFDEAEKEFLSAIKLGGEEMKEAHRMLANMYIAKGDNPQALEQLKIYLKLNPTAPDADHLRQVMSQLKDAPK